MPRNKKEIDRVHDIVEQCSDLLHGEGPDVQGAVLAELLSMWLAGFDEDMREPMLAFHLSFIRPLIRINAAIIRGESPPKN